jgi:Orsellinic acid/F9775 biosynthesis cluster protein D
MAGAHVEDEFFEHLAEYQLAICKECRHAVWPDQIEGHLQGKNHKVERKKAISIADRVREWPGLIMHPSEMQVPGHVDRPISQLPLYQDGLLCQLDPARCHYICQGLKSIKEH